MGRSLTGKPNPSPHKATHPHSNPDPCNMGSGVFHVRTKGTSHVRAVHTLPHAPLVGVGSHPSVHPRSIFAVAPPTQHGRSIRSAVLFPFPLAFCGRGRKPATSPAQGKLA